MLVIASSLAFEVFNQILGWIYFVAWSVSFYPQLITNYRRKSVIGLNLDFVLLNFVGFVCYSVFNVGIYQIYQPGTNSNPVEVNDIVFGIHAAIVTALTLFQTIIYERGGQKVSPICFTFLAMINLTLSIAYIAYGARLINLPQLFYAFSYVKLIITLIKYIPQVWLNYTRKCTVGWNIWGVVLDTTGGIFSLAQMFLTICGSSRMGYMKTNSQLILAHLQTTSMVASSDNSICIVKILRANPTKMLLSLTSMAFDLVFYVQHFVIYRHRSPDVTHMDHRQVNDQVLPAVVPDQPDSTGNLVAT